MASAASTNAYIGLMHLRQQHDSAQATHCCPVSPRCPGPPRLHISYVHTDNECCACLQPPRTAYNTLDLRDLLPLLARMAASLSPFSTAPLLQSLSTVAGAVAYHMAVLPYTPVLTPHACPYPQIVLRRPTLTVHSHTSQSKWTCCLAP